MAEERMWYVHERNVGVGLLGGKWQANTGVMVGKRGVWKPKAGNKGLLT